MKRVIRLSFIILIFTGLSASGQFQEILLKQTSKAGIYKKGQKISVYAFLEARKAIHFIYMF